MAMTSSSADQQSGAAAVGEAIEEEILVLYGSQTGNSEGAAKEIAALVPSKLPSSSSAAPRACTARCMHLDDFLEVEHGRWTRLVVIVCSSYGVGQAPIGARKFRDVCEAILEDRGGGDGDGGDKFLEGVSFALLGLGDSHYTTFFRNPTVIDEALAKAGARRVGELGKVDASGTGEAEQSRVIERWIDGVWDDLDRVVAEDRPGGDALERAREGTWDLCLNLFPEWKPEEGRAVGPVILALCVALGGVIISALVHYFLEQKSLDQKF